MSVYGLEVNVRAVRDVKTKGGRPMTSESKILTVSYGTFSCTLEGFDDPFNTMKAIAEYFRDLAADDRYFGAEPPQPDAAMLHRIAEREVSRIVDSRVGDNAVTLRPQAPASGDIPQPTARVTTQPRPSQDAGEGAATEPTLQDVIPTGVAAKLARIRQSVNPPFVPASVAEDALEALATDASVTDADQIDTEETAYAGSEADTAIETDSGDVLSRLDALMTDPSGDDFAEDLGTEADAEIDNAFGDVFDADAAPMLEDADAEDLGAEDPVAAEAADSVVAAQVDSWLLQAGTDDAAESAPETEVAPEPVVEAEADVEVEVLAEAEAPVEEASVDIGSAPEPLFETAEILASDDTAAEVDAASYEAFAEDAAPLMTEDLMAEDLLPEDAPAEDLSLTEALAADPLPEEAAPEPEPEPVAAAPIKSKTKRVSSRVVRIHPDDDDDKKRPDPNATRALDGSKDDEFARLLRQADDVMSDEDNRRRLDSIAHLKAAVAATEADRAAGTETKPAPGFKQEPYRDDLAQAVQPEPEPAPPEVKPRRKTISVRPQEPRPGTIRPGMISPPPLVLVSEQRIDRVAPPAPAYTPSAPAYAPPPAPAYMPPPEGQPMVALRTGRLTGAIGAAAASPVAPHQKLVLEQRAAAVEPDDEEDLHDDLSPIDEAGLVRFAEQVGVKSMADMLEAAAAYATCVENRSQFTRPQLMRRLMASAGGKPVSREDGLRSFGTLLRTGRIEKVSRGHYVLADHSPYLAEARRLA
jgi:hypothetical protein